MTAAQVTYENLFSQSRSNVVALLTFSHVPDPNISSAGFRKWIYSREPDVKSSDFNGYPFLIVHSSNVAIDEMGSVNGKSKNLIWDIELEVVTSDRGYGKKDGQGQSQMDTISNNVMKTFLNMTNRISLSNNSMKFSKPESTEVGTEIFHNELIFRRSIMLPFKSRIQVSA